MSCEPDAEGLRLGAVLVSAQRFAMPATGHIADLPTSLGLLPIAALGAGGGFALPLADGEAAWLGVLGPADGLTIAAVSPAGERISLPAVRRGGMVVFPGLPARGGYAPIGRGQIRALEIACGGAAATVYLLDPAAFAAATGRPPPPPAGSAYLGARLP